MMRGLGSFGAGGKRLILYYAHDKRTVVSTAVFLFSILPTNTKFTRIKHLSEKGLPTATLPTTPVKATADTAALLYQLLPHAHNGPLLGNRGRCRHPCTGKPSPGPHHVQVPHISRQLSYGKEYKAW